MIDRKDRIDTITEEVKLVIWDLDDTFWQGTLSEGPIRPVSANLDLVRQLVDRGIVCSICSKNEPAAVEQQLRALDIWDSFVLPRVSFAAKGRPIAEIIEALGLRPANVVFIDDNPAVLAEAAFHCPGLQCFDSPALLAAQIDSPFLQGKPGSGAARLEQYRRLAERQDARADFASDDTDFLRQSDIRIEIDQDVEPYLERIIELVNRSNQLNFTKRRIVTDADRRAFVESLSAFGFRAGVVSLWDRYADYGVIGFFLTLATLREYRLEHFVFSCRVMNMGVEQFVYDFLKRPQIIVVPPVANGLDVHPTVDWIRFRSEDDPVVTLRNFRLVVIGGCDMLQLSTYLSDSSTEFTNREVGGIIKRLDDPFLLLDDPEAVRASALRENVPAFNHQEMIELRQAVAGAEAIVVSLYRMMEINYFRGRDGLMVRLDEDAVRQILQSERGLWFIRHFSFVELSHAERLDLVFKSLAWLAAHSSESCKVIVILENVRNLSRFPDEIHHRSAYNRFIMQDCAIIKKVEYIDINAVTDERWLFEDGFHMSSFSI